MKENEDKGRQQGWAVCMFASAVFLAGLGAGCGDDDGAAMDAGARDGALVDAPADATVREDAAPRLDSGAEDSGARDAGDDDAGDDDAGNDDAGDDDAGARDAGSADTGPDLRPRAIVRSMNLLSDMVGAEESLLCFYETGREDAPFEISTAAVSPYGEVPAFTTGRFDAFDAVTVATCPAAAAAEALRFATLPIADTILQGGRQYTVAATGFAGPERPMVCGAAKAALCGAEYDAALLIEIDYPEGPARRPFIENLWHASPNAGSVMNCSNLSGGGLLVEYGTRPSISSGASGTFPSSYEVFRADTPSCAGTPAPADLLGSGDYDVPMVVSYSLALRGLVGAPSGFRTAEVLRSTNLR